MIHSLCSVAVMLSRGRGGHNFQTMNERWCNVKDLQKIKEMQATLSEMFLDLAAIAQKVPTDEKGNNIWTHTMYEIRRIKNRLQKIIEQQLLFQRTNANVEAGPVDIRSKAEVQINKEPE